MIRKAFLIFYGILAAIAVLLLVLQPVMPAASARMAPKGLEGEALVAATGLSFGQYMTAMHTTTVMGLVLMGLGGMVLLVAMAISLASRLGHFEREVHHYHEAPGLPPSLDFTGLSGRFGPALTDRPAVEVDLRKGRRPARKVRHEEEHDD